MNQELSQRSLHKLEYDKILHLLADNCSFGLSRELAENLAPVSDINLAGRLLSETDEGRELLRQQPLFSLGGLWDVRPALRHAEIGGILEPEALVQVAALCRAARMTKTFFSELKGSYPQLIPLGKALTVLKTVESAVEKAIGPDLSINDHASEQLAGIRRKRVAKSEQVRTRLDSLIKNPATAKFLQDPIVTIRDDRFVVPVKQEYRGAVAGVAHDMSSSGATLFIEPLAVMELNNELTALRHQEEEEIVAILRGLTMVALSFQAEISANLNLLAQLDFILAKAKLSWDMDGSAPKLNQHGGIRLRRARHPLIDAKQVVPIDVELAANINAMIITGPNTGGKTVTLKTIGLFTAMALSGLHIAADPGSELALFKQILVDIGDEQSIEQSLSTFSSHMTNIVAILDAADSESLLLFDELGAGTDPTEGAALAMSIIKHLQTRQIKCLATTHYSELKAFAYNTPGLINASMEFDLATLSPTYRLLVGLPGKSNAFEISRRLGLPEEIIATAAESLTSEDVAVSAMLANLEDLRRELAAEQEKARVFAASSAQREKALAAKEQRLAAEAAEIVRKAHQQAQAIIDDTLAKSRTLFEQEQRRLEEKQSSQRVWQESQRQLKSWREQLEESVPEPVFAGSAPTSVKLGDYVYLPKLNQYGNVASLPDKNNELTVQCGVIKLKAVLGDLRAADEAKLAKKGHKRGQGATTGDMTYRKSMSVSAKLDIRGQETMEALPLLDKYLDDAFIAGLRQVEIIHGRGTGALRAFVQDYLSSHRLVKSYREGEGSNQGATIVELNV